MYVPVFASRSYRRNLGERLTEAVVKEIESRTRYKVVHSPNADSVLTGSIESEYKDVLVEAPTDEPRESRLHLIVHVSWHDRRGDMIRPPLVVPVPPEIIDISGSATLVPEVGQSVAQSQQDAIQQLAARIVDMMEVPWGEEPAPAFVVPPEGL